MLAENEFSIEEEEVDEETEEKVRETFILLYFIVFFNTLYCICDVKHCPKKLISAYSHRFDDQFSILKLFWKIQIVLKDILLHKNTLICRSLSL